MSKERNAAPAAKKLKPEARQAVSEVPQPSLTKELKRVEEANLSFYEAFQKRDIEQMAQVWLRSPHTRCVHPGWELVVGWPNIRQSWIDIFRTVQDTEFRLEDIHIEVSGQTAWVNLIAHVEVTTDDSEEFKASVVTTNLFEHIENHWGLVLHHSSNFSEDDDEMTEEDLDLEDHGPISGAN